ADEALLDQVFGVAAGEEVRRRLETDETVIAANQPIVGIAVALLGKGDEETIIDLRFRVRVVGDSGHEQILSSGRPSGQALICSVAHSSPGAKAMYSKASQP